MDEKVTNVRSSEDLLNLFELKNLCKLAETTYLDMAEFINKVKAVKVSGNFGTMIDN